MSLKPIYTPENTNNPAYHLRYTWTGWPASTSANTTIPALTEEIISDLSSELVKDQIHLLEHQHSPTEIHLTGSTTPQVTPTHAAARLKGRLQHILRTHDRPASFSRKVSIRAIGDNRSDQVSEYIRQQVDNESPAFPYESSFLEFLESLTFVDENLDLSIPTETRSGRYWYNLHLVIVTEQRYRSKDKERVSKIFKQCFGTAFKKGHRMKAVSVIPEHVHLSVRANIEHTPEEVALAFLNNLAFSLNQKAEWRYGYYAGTFGEFDMYAVRQKAEGEAG